MILLALLTTMAPHSSPKHIGFFTLYLYVSDSYVSNVVKALWLALCVIVPADLLRFRSSRFERAYERVLGFLMRESEKVNIFNELQPIDLGS